MQIALQEAEKGMLANEVPVGAIVVHQEILVSSAYNFVEKKKEATAHAELLALRAACEKTKAKYLPHCTLYVTLEPCPMCAMACYWTQIGRIVFATKDPKKGYSHFSPSLIHPKTICTGGVLEEESKRLLQRFFQDIRKNKKSTFSKAPTKINK